MKTIVLSFRINPDHAAKALDGLLNHNIAKDQVNTITDIARLTFYCGLAYLKQNLSEPPSDDAISKLASILRQNKQLKAINYDDIVKLGHD